MIVVTWFCLGSLAIAFLLFLFLCHRRQELYKAFVLRQKQRRKDEDEYERKLEKLDESAAYVIASKKAMWKRGERG